MRRGYDSHKPPSGFAPGPLPAVLISLRRTPQRTAAGLSMLAALGLPIHVCWGADGQQHETTDWLPRDPRTRHIMQPGETALCMSWWQACSMIVARHWPAALIVEDDATPVKDASAIRAIVETLRSHAEHFDVALVHDQADPAPVEIPGMEIPQFRRVSRCSWSTSAVIITNAGARRILRSLPPFDRPFDVFLRDNEAGLRVYQPAQGLGWFNQNNWNPSTVRENGRAGQIPALLHQIWLGNDLPAEFAAYAETWKRNHPACAYRLWRDADAEREFSTHPAWPMVAKAETAAGKSDLIRLMILQRFGGLYVDTDFECVRSFDRLLGAGSLIVPDMIEGDPCNGLMAAVPNHPLVDQMLAASVDGIASGKPILEAAGPAMMKPLLLGIRRQWAKSLYDGERRVVGVAYGDSGLVVISPWVCFPYYWLHERPSEFGPAWAAHHWARSWWTPEQWETFNYGK